MSAPILTVTLNPAIDETVTLDTLRPGQVNRAREVRFDAGGKGVNAASCLADWGTRGITATGILGAGNAAVFEALFAAKGIEDTFLRAPGSTRTNIKLSHDRDTTDINLPGLPVSAAHAAAVLDRAEALAPAGTLVLLGGSLPEGLDDHVYARLTARLTARGARVLLDTAGAALTAALAAPVRPAAIKPNRAELAACTGTSLDDDRALLAAARALLGRGLALVVVSLGEQGALFVTQEAALRARLPAMRVTSTVGAGDAMVAGMIAGLAEGGPLARLACLATAFAAGKLTRTGPNLPSRPEVEALASRVHAEAV